MKYERISVSAPFAMPPIAVPDFTGAPEFPIERFGADRTDPAATSRALQAAIAAASDAGRGRVMVPAGTWRTAGPVHFRSNVALHLEEGAVLRFSPEPAHYLPPVQSSWEGVECMNYSPLVYAFECRNVAITGSGRLEADMTVWHTWSDRPKPHMDALVRLYELARRNVPVAQRDMTGANANLRPQFIQFNRCTNVLVEGISIENSPFWTIHPLLCTDVVIRRIKVRALGHNNDGVDPEMSENVLVEHCEFDQGDDAISVKSGRDMDAWRIGVPARNTVMRHCTIRNGHQMMAIGSELSAGIENVYVHDCHFAHSGSVTNSSFTNLLFIKTNERRGGFVRGIYLDKVSAPSIDGGVVSIDTDVLYQWRTLLPTYERRLTAIENIRVTNVDVGRAKFVCEIRGEADLPVRDVVLEGVTVGTTTAAPVSVRNAANVLIDGRNVSAS